MINVYLCIVFVCLVSLSGGPRKAKRVSDVSAMGAPSPVQQYSPNPMYNPGYPAGPPPPYQEGIQLDHGQDFGTTEPSGSKLLGLIYYCCFSKIINNQILLIL